MALLLIAGVLGLTTVPAWSAPPSLSAAGGRAGAGLDFTLVASRFPRFKTLLKLSFQRPLSMARMVRLLNRKVYPLGGSLLAPLGRRQALFFTRAMYLAGLKRSGLARQVKPMVRFRLGGLYRLYFQVVHKGFAGAVRLRLATPRPGPGRRLVLIEPHLYPKRPYVMVSDRAGNRWLEVNYPQLMEGQVVKFAFYFRYQVDLNRLLAQALAMMPTAEVSGPLTPGHPARGYLKPADKIKSDLAGIKEMAAAIFGPEPAYRRRYRRLIRFIKRRVIYDHAKRARFFGGQKVYRAMSEMYRDPLTTLALGLGACPDTALLEVALLRAGGMPARTAARWGHIYSEVFLPGRGWLSTSLTPTGILLKVDPDHRHTPFASWQPRAALKITLWQGQVRIEE